MDKRQHFAKPALTLPQQIHLLKTEGFQFSNIEHARQCLSVVSFHRLSTYCKASQKLRAGQRPLFEDAWTLYVFDRELRLLISDALERIEVAFRTALSNEMSVFYDPHWYTHAELFSNPNFHRKLLHKIRHICDETEHVERQHQSEIKRYQQQYHTPVEPPSWVILEALPFGACSKLYRNIKTVKDRRRVSDVFSLHPTTLASWIQALSYLRNLCAHHSRVWNRWLVKIPHHLDRHAQLHQTPENERLLYPHLAVIALLLAKISPQSLWKDRLYALFEEYTAVPIHWIGFQPEWTSDLFWELPA